MKVTMQLNPFRINKCGVSLFPAGSKEAPLPHVMGILNVNSDSFSDGSAYLNPEKAVSHGIQMLHDGAAILDIGAESTRPGAKELPASLEIQRLLPVIRGVLDLEPDALISVDTRKAEVADAVLSAGAAVINDVSGLAFDSDRIAEVVARHGAGLILMHMRGIPETMQNAENLMYQDLLGEITEFLCHARERAERLGVPRESILFDPGIGFSKDGNQNLTLIRAVDAFHDCGAQVLYGVSRKSFIGSICGRPHPLDRDFGTAGILACLTAQNADFLRVHNVRGAIDVIKMFDVCAKKKKI